MADEVTENLILAIEAMGMPEAIAAVDDLTDSVDELGASIDRADMAVAGGESEAGKGGLMGALTSLKALFAGLGIYEGLKQFSSFQSQMEKTATQAGASQKEVSSYSNAILHMATGLGTAPMELAEGFYHVYSAGIKGQQGLNFLSIAAKGAKISGAALTETIESLDAVMNAGFRGVTSFASAMGQMNAIVGHGDLTMAELNSMLSTGFISTMKLVHLHLDEVGAAMDVFAKNNIRGTRAANALRMGLSALIHPSEKVEETMAQVGLKPLRLLEVLEKKGLVAMFKELETHIKGLTESQQHSAIMGIFGGGRTGAGMITLMKHIPEIQKLQKEIGKSGSVTAFDKAWKATTKTLSFFGDELKTLAQVLLIKLGGALQPVAHAVESFAKALMHGKLWAELLGGALLGLAVGVEVFKTLTAATKVWQALSDTNPWILAITAIVVVLVLLATHFKQVKAIALDAWHWIEKAAVDAFDWIKSNWPLLAAIILTPFSAPIDVIVYLFRKQLLGAAVSVWDWIKTAWGKIEVHLTSPFKELWSVVKTVATGIVHAISWAVREIERLLGSVLGPLKSVAHFAGGLLGGAGHVVGDVGHFLGLANGTPQVTSGGVFTVGERGRELVYLPRGAAVQPNDEMGSALAKALAPLARAGGDRDLNITLQVDGQVLSRAVVREGLMRQSRQG